MSEPRFYLSPVDYTAWRKGYMPPSEHLLIHELSCEGARVVSSSSGGAFSFWLVVKGKPDRKGLSAISRSLHEQFFDLEMVGAEGIEPSASCVSSKRSPDELSALGSPQPNGNLETPDNTGA